MSPKTCHMKFVMYRNIIILWKKKRRKNPAAFACERRGMQWILSELFSSKKPDFTLIRKGNFSVENGIWKGKGLDLWVEPPISVNFIQVSPRELCMLPLIMILSFLSREFLITRREQCNNILVTGCRWKVCEMFNCVIIIIEQHLTCNFSLQNSV